MFKKCLAALLALAVMISVLPAVPAQAAVLAQHKTNAANSAALVSKTNAADAVRQAAEQQVKAYAKSIAVKNSGDEAVEQLVRHAMFKNGKQLNAGEGAALTAALMKPVADGDLSACIHDFSGILMLFFIIQLCVGAMFLLLIAQLVAVSGMTVMLR